MGFPLKLEREKAMNAHPLTAKNLRERVRRGRSNSI
jgi:hypothetical protein